MKYDVVHFLKACLPAWIALAGYVAFLPLSGMPAWDALAWHQQAVQIASVFAIAWSIYRYNAGLDDAKPTPEERVLDDADGWTNADD